jgi:hypothetical protein
MFANLKLQDDVQAEKDVVGGNFGPLESGIYPAKVTMAYTGVSAGGANSVTIHLMTGEGKELRETLWVTSGTAKGCLNTYTKQDGTKEYLPGFNLLESLTNLTIGKHAADLEPENKVIKLWNSELKKEAPTEKPVITELLDQEVYVAVQKCIVDKNVKNAEGNYVPSGETREVNEIAKFFRASDKMTTAELRGGATEAEYYNTWVERNSGKTRDKSTKDAAANAGVAGAPAQAAAAAAPRPSLFAG